MIVAVVDYGSGNLRSVAKALERAAVEIGLDVEVAVTSDAERVGRAERVVLPGVGALGDCRRGLDGLPGMIEALEAVALGAGRPFLGICVGMQLMATLGHEHGEHPGLDWIPGEIVQLEPDVPALKVPHMGWNKLEVRQPDHPVLSGLTQGVHAYFVHSYHFVAVQPEHVLATTDYGGPVTAMIGRDSLIGTQFHPEKSQTTGLRLLANFLDWRP